MFFHPNFPCSKERSIALGDNSCYKQMWYWIKYFVGMVDNSGIFTAHRSMSTKHIYTRLLLHKVQKFSITSYVWFCWISDCSSLWVFWIICSPWLWIDSLLTFGLLRSYSNGRPEHAAFSWRTCSWDTRGKYPSIPTPLCSTPARSW